MKCARCNASLDDGVMVCSHCGAVVGMSYAKGPGVHKPISAPKPVAPAMGALHRTGTSKPLIRRVKAILTSPRAEWNVIAAEPMGIGDVWMGYVLPLALIGPVSLAIAEVGFGTAFPMFGVVKVDLVTGIAAALLAFFFSIVQVAVLAWAVNAMAPKFQAVPDRLAALQVVAYSMTPVWLVGILYLVPFLAFLWIVAAAYALAAESGSLAGVVVTSDVLRAVRDGRYAEPLGAIARYDFPVAEAAAEATRVYKYLHDARKPFAAIVDGDRFVGLFHADETLRDFPRGVAIP